jgi:autotransporter translocation and assembly factor TamB
MRRALLVSAALLGALALAVSLVARSEAALRFAAARVKTLTHGRVVIEGASGSLLGPLRAERVVVTAAGGTRTIVERSELEPRWRALLGGALSLDSVTVELLRVEPGPERDEPPTVPETIASPFPIEIERVEIKRIRIGERTEPGDCGACASPPRHTRRDSRSSFAGRELGELRSRRPRHSC